MSIPFDYLLKSWVRNNSLIIAFAIVDCFWQDYAGFIDRDGELHALKSLELKFG